MNEQDKEAFGKWFDKNWQDSDDKDVFTQAWQAACLYKQKEIDELKQKLSTVWKEAEEFYLED